MIFGSPHPFFRHRPTKLTRVVQAWSRVVRVVGIFLSSYFHYNINQFKKHGPGGLCGPGKFHPIACSRAYICILFLLFFYKKNIDHPDQARRIAGFYPDQNPDHPQTARTINNFDTISLAAGQLQCCDLVSEPMTRATRASSFWYQPELIHKVIICFTSKVMIPFEKISSGLGNVWDYLDRFAGLNSRGSFWGICSLRFRAARALALFNFRNRKEMGTFLIALLQVVFGVRIFDGTRRLQDPWLPGVMILAIFTGSLCQLQSKARIWVSTMWPVQKKGGRGNLINLFERMHI